jgi:hypothetical protein
LPNVRISSGGFAAVEQTEEEEGDAMTATLTPRERELARHALGLPNERNISCGNSYWATVRSEPHRVWRQLASRQLAYSDRYMMTDVFCSDEEVEDEICYRLTRAGALAALEDGEVLDEGDFPG